MASRSTWRPLFMLVMLAVSPVDAQFVTIDSDQKIDAANSLPSTAIVVRDGLESATHVELAAGGQLSTAVFGSSRITGESTLAITNGEYGGEISVEEGAHLEISGGRYIVPPNAPHGIVDESAIRLESGASLNMTGGELDLVPLVVGGGIHADGETSLRISNGNVRAWYGYAVKLEARAKLVFSGGELTSREFPAVFATDSSSVYVSGGTINGGEEDAALELADHAHAVITGGQIVGSDSGSAAIYANGNSSAWIENAELRFDDAAGVVGRDRASLTILAAQIQGRDGPGLVALGDAHILAVDSRIWGSDATSVSASDASHITLVGVDMGVDESTILGVSGDAVVDLWDSSAVSDDGTAVRVFGNGTLNIRSAALTSKMSDDTLEIGDNGTVRIFATQLENLGNRVQGVFRDGREFDWTYDLVSLGAQIELIDLLRADYNSDGALTARDIDLLGEAIRTGSNETTFDLDKSGQVNFYDLDLLVDDYLGTAAGDANLDVRFDSSDFVTVFQAGRYETGLSAAWNSGDWNQDGLFDSGDMVTAFQAGGYLGLASPTAVAVAEPSGMGLLIVGILVFLRFVGAGVPRLADCNMSKCRILRMRHAGE